MSLKVTSLKELSRSSETSERLSQPLSQVTFPAGSSSMKDLLYTPSMTELLVRSSAKEAQLPFFSTTLKPVKHLSQPLPMLLKPGELRSKSHSFSLTSP